MTQYDPGKYNPNALRKNRAKPGLLGWLEENFPNTFAAIDQNPQQSILDQRDGTVNKHANARRKLRNHPRNSKVFKR